MIKQELFVVLKRLQPHQQKYAVFGKTIGKSVVLVGSPRDARLLWPGAIISGALEKWRESSHYRVGRHELLGVWHELAPETLAFYHQFLEFTYYFIPAGTISPSLFESLYTALSLSVMVDREDARLWQGSCKAKLLAVCGFYPPDELQALVSLFDRCEERFIDDYDYEAITSELKSFSCILDRKEAMLSAWMHDCISSHPCFAQFRTMGTYPI